MSHKLDEIISLQLAKIDSQLLAAWTELSGSNVLLTGGSGFFGCWILSAINYLNQKYKTDIKCHILSRNPSRVQRELSFLTDSKYFQFIAGDVRNIKIHKLKFDYIVHGATTSARETYSGTPSLEKFNLLVDGTRNILKEALDSNCKRALLLSSGVVYDVQTYLNPISEDNTGSPLTVLEETGLAHGKRAAEYIFSETCRGVGVDYKIARCFTFVGAGLPSDIHYAIGNFVALAIQGKDINIYSDGLALRSYLDMRDFVTWLGLMLSNHTNHSVYNIGSPVAITIKDLAEKIVTALASPSVINVLGDKNYAIGNTPRCFYVPCIDRFESDYSPPELINLKDAILDYAKSVEK